MRTLFSSNFKFIWKFIQLFKMRHSKKKKNADCKCQCHDSEEKKITVSFFQNTFIYT